MSLGQRRSKLQNSSFKLQGSIKLQIPRVSRASQAGLSWSLRLDVSLKLGVWSLELFPTFFV